MTAKECVPGESIEYSPSPGYWFSGTIRTEPWQLGSGTWVTHLCDMEPAYGEFCSKSGDKKTNVYAAALCRIRRRNHFQMTAEERTELLHEPVGEFWLCAGECGQWRKGMAAAHNGSGYVCGACEENNRQKFEGAQQ